MKIFKNFHPVPMTGEKNDEISQTVPDMAMSIPQLIERFQRGQPIPTRQGQYDDDYIPNLQHMDLVDASEYAQEMGATLREYEEVQRLKKEQEATAIAELAIASAVEKRLSELEPNNPT